MSRSEPPSRRTAALILLGAAMVISATLVLHWTRGSTFVIDEWDFLVTRRDWNLTTLLQPHNGHLVLTQVLSFKALIEIFGASSHLPLKLLTIVLQLGTGALVYIYARRRVGRWVALMPALLVIFLGSGWEVMINVGASCNMLSLVGGIGMLLCLEREDSRGDTGACLLLAFSLASFTIGLAFAVAAAVEVVLSGRGRERWRRLWIVAAPLALYAIWFVWARKFHQTDVSNLAFGLITGVKDQLASIAAAITGVFYHRATSDIAASIVQIPSHRATAAAVLLVAAIALRLWRGPRPTPRTWAILALLGSYLLLVGLGLGTAGRLPYASRYVYMGVVLVLLVIVQLCEGLRIRRGWVLAAAAITAVSLAANIATLHTAGRFLRVESAYNRAELAALELVRGQISPTFVPETQVTTILPHRDLLFTARDYYETIDRFGSPAYSKAQLESAPEPAREAADVLLGQALRLRAVPVRRLKCGLSFAASSAGDEPVVTVRPGETIGYRTAGPPPIVQLGRFSDGYPISLFPAGRMAIVHIPADAANDGSGVKWHLRVDSTAATRVCGI